MGSFSTRPTTRKLIAVVPLKLPSPVNPPLNFVNGEQYTVIGPLNNTPATPFELNWNVFAPVSVLPTTHVPLCPSWRKTTRFTVTAPLAIGPPTLTCCPGTRRLELNRKLVNWLCHQ